MTPIAARASEGRNVKHLPTSDDPSRVARSHHRLALSHTTAGPGGQRCELGQPIAEVAQLNVGVGSGLPVQELFYAGQRRITLGAKHLGDD